MAAALRGHRACSPIRRRRPADERAGGADRQIHRRPEVTPECGGHAAADSPRDGHAVTCAAAWPRHSEVTAHARRSGAGALARNVLEERIDKSLAPRKYPRSAAAMPPLILHVTAMPSRAPRHGRGATT